MGSDGGKGEDPEGAEAGVPEELADGDDLHGSLFVTMAEAADYSRIEIADRFQTSDRGRSVRGRRRSECGRMSERTRGGRTSEKIRGFRG